MKVLVLGVNGFIGHHLVQRILGTTDWTVYGMDLGFESGTNDSDFDFSFISHINLPVNVVDGECP